MFLPVYLYGHPVLREPTKEIDSSYPELDKLIADMWQTMYESDGIGLAAPQIGRAIRLFVIDADALAEYYPECKGFKRVFINARIVEHSQDTISESEGCLSIPGINENVVRPKSITIEYLDEQFQPHKETLSGFAARVVQHEYDHIECVLFTDRVSPFRKRMIKKKLDRIERGEYVSQYPHVTAPRKAGIKH